MRDEYFSNRNNSLIAAWALIAYYNCMGEVSNGGSWQPWLFVGLVSLKERSRILVHSKRKKKTQMKAMQRQGEK